jgi:hypothetical protein
MGYTLIILNILLTQVVCSIHNQSFSKIIERSDAAMNSIPISWNRISRWMIGILITIESHSNIEISKAGQNNFSELSEIRIFKTVLTKFETGISVVSKTLFETISIRICWKSSAKIVGMNGRGRDIVSCVTLWSFESTSLGKRNQNAISESEWYEWRGWWKWKWRWRSKVSVWSRLKFVEIF